MFLTVSLMAFCFCAPYDGLMCLSETPYLLVCDQVIWFLVDKVHNSVNGIN